MVTDSFLIGAATSNSGKTTFTMGLLRILRNRGMKVQPYKCGPDYIDTMFHHLSSGRESINLDTFMSSNAHVIDIFNRYGNGADVRVVEGVMGLYDGYNKSHGSSAEIGMLLDIPVILIINAKSTAYSVAPQIFGFKHFNPNLKLAGVVFNMVASENHYNFLRDACKDAGVHCLGYMANNPQLIIPNRHLGLTISVKEEMESLIKLAAEEVEKHVDVDGLLDIIHENTSTNENNNIDENHSALKDENILKLNNGINYRTKIAIANDEAFNFTYKANIDRLTEIGDITFFSPLKDKTLPKCDMLYLPGGYPELFTKELSSNISMRNSIKEYAEKHGIVYAECGGFMYLCKDIDGSEMCNVFPFSATMQNARLHLGYRSMLWHDQIIRGHEFHYSEIVPQEVPDNITVEQGQHSAAGKAVSTPIYHYKNVIAGYTHWYWADKT